jgi:murein L,D-transpeptidase YcbB/YkuD
VKEVASALRKAEGGSPKALARAEMLLSRSFVAYVRDVRSMQVPGMIYVDRSLAPRAPNAQSILGAVAAAPSLSQYVANGAWMHPIYGQLRGALADADPRSEEARLLRLNLNRARVLPADTSGRHIVVDAAGAKLLMYENGEVRDTMRVIVGKQTDPTPQMAAYIRYASVNPYWNIPADLARERIAPAVLKEGLPYLKKNGYEVLSDWSTKANVTNPKLVNWDAVAAGRQELRVRQKPGPNNGMGRVKFMFPNDQGIYLHDTPDRTLFREEDRSLSAGCVRLEDAGRLGRWLFGKPLPTKTKKPEQRVDLPAPVPVYITYLTAFPEAGRIAFHGDRYGRDRAQPVTGKSRRMAGL